MLSTQQIARIALIAELAADYASPDGTKSLTYPGVPVCPDFQNKLVMALRDRDLPINEISSYKTSSEDETCLRLGFKGYGSLLRTEPRPLTHRIVEVALTRDGSQMHVTLFPRKEALHADVKASRARSPEPGTPSKENEESDEESDEESEHGPYSEDGNLLQAPSSSSEDY